MSKLFLVSSLLLVLASCASKSDKVADDDNKEAKSKNRVPTSHFYER